MSENLVEKMTLEQLEEYNRLTPEQKVVYAKLVECLKSKQLITQSGISRW